MRLRTGRISQADLYVGELKKKVSRGMPNWETGSQQSKPVSSVYGLDMVVVVPSTLVNEMLKCSLYVRARSRR
jgi:hypothetical protein